MATKVVMEALSPTMEEGRLVKWLKNEGDVVKSGETLAEVETDKAIMELVARGDGVLRKRLLADGGTTPVGTLIAVIASADENIDALVAGAGGAAATAQPSGAAAPPDATASAAAGAGTIGGGAATPPPATPPASGTTEGERETTSPVEGGSSETSPGAESPRGGPPAGESTSNAEPPRDQTNAPGTGPSQSSAPPASETAADGGRMRTSPLARRLASERGIDLAALHGSGPGGRIIKRDIESAQSGPPVAAAVGATSTATPALASQAPIPMIAGADFTDVPLTQIRKTIARRLAESSGPIPTFFLTSEFDLERVAEMRTAMAEMGDAYKVSFNDIALKAVAVALAQHPECNAHWLGDGIRYFRRVHLGMAVAIPDGLITPVIFDAQSKRLSEIGRESRDLAARARERKLKPNEYTGSTFSVSNLGMFGIDQFTAIINPPEAGILAIGAVESKAIVVDGTVTVRKRMRVTMSCDHRVIDGALGAKFLQTLRRLIENPLMLVY
ncbi:MAG: pyruvate dehydrogenase complex dihydrolipoamide acetyltransferase [Gemmatimonadaceae bacterium]